MKYIHHRSLKNHSLCMKIPEQKLRPHSQYYSALQLKKNKILKERIRSAPLFIIALKSHIHIN